MIYKNMNLTSKQFKSIVQGSTNSIQVNDDLSFAIRKWKKNLKENNVVKILFDRKFYTKPSVSKKRQQEMAEYNQRKVDETD